MSHERSRKNLEIILRSLRSAGQANVARAMEVGEGTVSKMQVEGGELKVTWPAVSRALETMGLKVVPETYRCVNPETFEIIFRGHQLWSQSLKNPDQLLFEDQE